MLTMIRILNAGIVYFSLGNGDDYSVTGWNIEGAEMLDISLNLPLENYGRNESQEHVCYKLLGK